MINSGEQWQRIRARGMLRFVALYGLSIAVVWSVTEVLLRYLLSIPSWEGIMLAIIIKSLFGGFVMSVVLWFINEGRYRKKP